jgi:hypothetical protein
MRQFLHQSLEQLEFLGRQIGPVRLGIGDQQIGCVGFRDDVVDRPPAAAIAFSRIAEATFRRPPDPGITSPMTGSAAIIFSMATMSASDAPSFFRRLSPF